MSPVTIERVSLRLVNLPPKVLRTDAIQSFVTQETILLTLHCSDGINATGYAYTIGTGGSSVIALLKDHLAPRLIGRDPVMVEAIWKDLFFHTHATAVGAMTSLALACVDTALWDWRAQSQGLPLWRLLGGAQARVPLYTTEGGWLHLSPQALVDQTLEAQAQGFKGAKIKIGRPHVSEDVARLSAVRDAVGPSFELMTDANQGFNRAEVARAHHHPRGGGRVDVPPDAVSRIFGARRLLDRAARCGPHWRYHTLDQDRAPGRNF
jgi:L-alanine-DL-glutamate epimerase-like enolase superfamily enzyme